MPKSKLEVVDGLSVFLSSSYVLYLKTQNFHWNVTGPNFFSLHQLFEVHYTELATAIDEIAERIRGLGAFAPGSFSVFSTLSLIKEETKVPAAPLMIKQLVDDHEVLIKYGREVIEAAEDAKDPGTADLITIRVEAHEKAGWMLRSHLEK